jgi:hypothetical protein
MRLVYDICMFDSACSKLNFRYFSEEAEILRLVSVGKSENIYFLVDMMHTLVVNVRSKEPCLSCSINLMVLTQEVMSKLFLQPIV